MAIFSKKKPRFPTLALILLVVAVVWFLQELKYLNIDIPWLPLILIIVAVGMIANRYSCC
ncbi:MAG: hypothetical protein ABIH72_03735 [archaeon]